MAIRAADLHGRSDLGSRRMLEIDAFTPSMKAIWLNGRRQLSPMISKAAESPDATDRQRVAPSDARHSYL